MTFNMLHYLDVQKAVTVWSTPWNLVLYYSFYMQIVGGNELNDLDVGVKYAAFILT